MAHEMFHAAVSVQDHVSLEQVAADNGYEEFMALTIEALVREFWNRWYATMKQGGQERRPTVLVVKRT